jgi:hypothetical protein
MEQEKKRLLEELNVLARILIDAVREKKDKL